MCKRR
ncbi:hypothetical protein YPPY72_0272, partial [Yersinia pestis PY-72]